MRALVSSRISFRFVLMVLPLVVLLISCSSDTIDLADVENQDKIITSGKYDKKVIKKLIRQYIQAVKKEKSKEIKAKTHLRVAILYYLINQKGDALIYVTNSINYNKTDFNAFFLRGLIYEEKGKLNLAFLDYQKVIQINPETIDIYERRGLIYFKLKKLDDAIKDFTQEIRQDPSRYYPYILRGDTYRKLKKYKLAIYDYTKAITILRKIGVCTSKDKTCFSPIEIDVYLKIGEIYEKQGLYKKAITTYTDAIRSNPGSPKPYNNLGWLYLTVNNLTIRDYRKAIRYAEKANQLSKGSDAEILDTLATVYFTNKKYKAAYELIVKANKLAPESTKIEIKLKKYREKYQKNI